MSKSTPGPWHLGTNSYAKEHVITDDNNSLYIKIDHFQRHGLKRATADANLIAASPEMLGALKIALDLMESMEWNGDLDLQKEWDNSLNTSKKAIAKAKGKS